MKLRFIWRSQYGLLAAWIITLFTTATYLAIVEASEPKPVLMLIFAGLSLAVLIYWNRGEAKFGTSPDSEPVLREQAGRHSS